MRAIPVVLLWCVVRGAEAQEVRPTDSTCAGCASVAAASALGPRTSRLWVASGGHTIGGVLLHREMQASWGESNGRFHIKDDWSGDGLSQNDEISHFVTAYGLTKAFSRIWGWTGVSPRQARTLAAVETGSLLTLVETLDAFNPRQGLGVSDLVFDFAGIGVGLLALRHPGRWDIKFSAKNNLFRAQKTLFAQDARESDYYVFWATYRLPLGWAERQPLSVGLGHSVRRGADGISPERELYLGLGTTVPDVVRSVAPGAARYFEPLEVYYFNVRVRATVR